MVGVRGEVGVGPVASLPSFVVTWTCPRCCAGWEAESSGYAEMKTICFMCGGEATHRGLRISVPLW